MSLQRKLLNHKFIKHFSTTSSSNPTLKSTSTSTSSLSTSTSTSSSSSSSSSDTWRNEAKQHQLISQITLILLQRNNWSSLLKTLNFSSKLIPNIFHQIIHKTQRNPQISLSFFNWVTSNFVNFQPFLKTQCKIIQISLGSDGPGGAGRSGLTRPVKVLLDSVIEVNPLTNVVCSMSYACKGTNLHSFAFSCIIESYALKGLYDNGLEIYREIVLFGCLPKVGCLNVLLDVLDSAREFKLSYCLLGSMFRNRILMDDDTWGVIGRILCKDGKFECVVRLLDSGVCNSSIFELVIDGYSKNGNFEGAFGYLSEMCRRGFEPGFCSYGCILNGACEFGDSSVRDTVLFEMMEKGLVPVDMVLGYDDAIVKLCDLEKIYAAEYMFRRAQSEGVGLKDAAFGCMLRAFLRAGRVSEAIELYRIILKEKIVVNSCCYQQLANCICNVKPEEDTVQFLMRLIKRGFSPSVSSISKFMMKLGREQRWQEVETLMNVLLQVELLPDSGFCRLLVNHYCSSRKVDSALLMHDKVGNTEGLWDVTTYNVLLRALFMEKRVDEAIAIFECMRKKNVVNKASFLVMISGLSHEKEMRKAMKVHDDMLKLGLKPSSQKYKNLISVFR